MADKDTWNNYSFSDEIHIGYSCSKYSLFEIYGIGYISIIHYINLEVRLYEGRKNEDKFNCLINEHFYWSLCAKEVSTKGSWCGSGDYYGIGEGDIDYFPVPDSFSKEEEDDYEK